MNLVTRVLTALLAVGLAVPVSAQTTVYTSSTSFLSVLESGFYTENFNGANTGTETTPLSFSGGPFSYSVASVGGVYRNFALIGSNLEGNALTITFTSGNVNAVGANFFLTDIDDVFRPRSISIGLNDGTTVAFTPASIDAYRGFTSTVAITSLTMNATPANFNSLDNLTVGIVAVPEPSSMALASLGLVGLVFLRRRRSKMNRLVVE